MTNHNEVQNVPSASIDHRKALQEAERNAATITYFGARPDFESPGTRMLFEAGFDRGFARALLSASPTPPAGERQEPVFWYRPRGDDGGYEGPIHNSSIERVRKESGGWVPLYRHPAPQAAQPAQDDQIAALVNRLRDVALEFHASQQLRERISQIVVPLLKPAAKSAQDERPVVPDDEQIADAWVTASDCDGIAYDGPSFEAGYQRAALSTPPMEGDAPDGFYLQDSRNYVGNCPMWWKEGGGYTTNVDEAERWTADRARIQHQCRETDVPWPCAHVDALRRATIDFQYLGSIPKQVDAFRAAIAAMGKGGSHAGN